MKIKVPQGESHLVNGIWYNQGQEYDAEETVKSVGPVEVVESKGKKSKEKNESTEIVGEEGV